jgi:hypothetical protein
MEAVVSRQCWRATEPVHAQVYFAPEPKEELAALGHDLTANPAAGYFVPRSAAFGAVGPGAVVATFFSFAPAVVERGLRDAWVPATPAQVVDARWRGAERALRRMCAGLLDSPELAEAVDLARRAADGCTPDGRPLYAAHADLDWPDPLPLQLFHAVTLLREHRGDGHIAVLVAEGISGLESAVLHVAQGDAWTREPLRKRRGWSTEQWDAAVGRLRERGWLDASEGFTEQGAAARAHVEARTDALALPAWEPLGEDGCRRLRALVRPLSSAIVAAGGIGIK